MAIAQKPEKLEKKENTYDRFKWINRPKATTLAVQLKAEENITAEEACRRILEEYNEIYLFNPEMITEKRMENFIQRVEENKSYIKSQGENPGYTMTQSKIVELKDEGTITELQAIVLDCIFNELSFSSADLEVTDLIDTTGLKSVQVKGSLLHLTQKGFIETEKKTVEDVEVTVITIKEDKMELYNDDILEKRKNG